MSYLDSVAGIREHQEHRAKWEVLQARVDPEEKQDVVKYCRGVAKLPYSLITRLIWRRIISEYKTMPQARSYDAMQDVNREVDYVLAQVPVIRQQSGYVRKL